MLNYLDFSYIYIKINIMKTQKILAGFGIFSLVTVVVLTISSFTTTETTDFITKKSSRDGITVYSYGSYIIVKTDHSVSVSR